MFPHDLKIPVVGVCTLILPKFNDIKRVVNAFRYSKLKFRKAITPWVVYSDIPDILLYLFTLHMSIPYYMCNVYKEAANIYVAPEIHHHTFHIYILQDGFPNHLQCLCSLNGKTSYRHILWNLEATRMDVIMIVSLWHLTGTSAALLPRCLSNFRAIGKV